MALCATPGDSSEWWGEGCGVSSSEGGCGGGGGDGGTGGGEGGCGEGGGESGAGGGPGHAKWSAWFRAHRELSGYGRQLKNEKAGPSSIMRSVHVPPFASRAMRSAHQQFTIKSRLSCTGEPRLYMCCKLSTVPVLHIGELCIGGQGGGGGGGGEIGGGGICGGVSGDGGTRCADSVAV